MSAPDRRSSLDIADGDAALTGRRVLIYGINYPPELAGVGRYTGEIGQHLHAEGADVEVITAPPHYPGWKVKPPFANRYSTHREPRLRICRCPLLLRERMSGLWRFLAPLSFAISSGPVAVWRILRARPDTVIVVEPTLFAAPIALLAAKAVGSFSVLHIQDLEVDAAFAVGHLKARRSVVNFAMIVERVLLRRFDRMITISNRMSERVAAKTSRPERVHVVRNWVDTDQIRPLPPQTAYRQELGLSAGDFVVLYSGNLGLKQGVGLITEAAALLGPYPHIKFVVAGQGPLRAQLDTASGVLPNLKVVDFQPAERFAEFLAVADIHILPQASEAADLLLPSKLGGLLASGRPIVVTAKPGTELADFLGSSCTLIEPGLPEALAQAILAAAQPDAVDGQRAQRLALAQTLSKRRLIGDFADLALSRPRRRVDKQLRGASGSIPPAELMTISNADAAHLRVKPIAGQGRP
jgi:colanic acid biosynthesis glycosyl transferase WcaI